MKRSFITVLLAVALPIGAALDASTGLTAVRRTINPCMADTAIMNYVLYRLEGILDAPSSDTARAELRAATGLTGAQYANVVVVSDSATCESARAAYSGLVYPAATDTAFRRRLDESLTAVLLVRITPDRYLLSSHIFNAWTLYEQFLVDSTYTLVTRF